MNQKGRKNVIQTVLNLKYGSVSFGKLHAAGFKSYRERLTQTWESGATAITAYKLSGNCMAHRHRGGRVREMNVCGLKCERAMKYVNQNGRLII